MIVPVWLLVFSSVISAEQTLSDLMRVLKSEQAVKMRYKETRTLELMTDNWQGSGYLYSLPPALFILEQLTPEPRLMAVSDLRVLYYEPDSGTRYQGAIDYQNPMMLKIVVFKALVNGDLGLLQQFFDLTFSYDITKWQLRLNAKQNPDMRFKLNGFNNNRSLSILGFTDNDEFRYDLESIEQASQLTNEIKELQQQLNND